jgi:hypothetical protein
MIACASHLKEVYVNLFLGRHVEESGMGTMSKKKKKKKLEVEQGRRVLLSRSNATSDAEENGAESSESL